MRKAFVNIVEKIFKKDKLKKIDQFFKDNKILISQQIINLIVGRCRGDRQNLSNELEKIKK